MRRDLFDQLVESVKEMKAIQAGRRKPSRITRAEEMLNSATSPPVIDGAITRARASRSWTG